MSGQRSIVFVLLLLRGHMQVPKAFRHFGNRLIDTMESIYKDVLSKPGTDIDSEWPMVVG